MKCSKCLMNPATVTGLCLGCTSEINKDKDSSPPYPLKEVYTLLIDGTVRGEVFEFEGDSYLHDVNDRLQLAE